MTVCRLEALASSGIRYPGTEVKSWLGSDLALDDSGTHFGYVFRGSARLRTALDDFPVPEGCFFAVPGAARLRGDGRGLVVTRTAYYGIFSVGGPLEEVGRLP